MKKILYLSLLLCAVSSCSTTRIVDTVDYDSYRRDYFYYEAINQLQQENYDAAYDLLNYCNNIDTTSAAVNYNLAEMYILMNNRTIPDSLLQRALRQDPDNYWYHNLTARYYAQTNRPLQAITQFEVMMDKFPARTDVLLTLAELYDETRQYKKELQVLNKYAIIEYLSELSDNKMIDLLILTHNFVCKHRGC